VPRGLTGFPKIPTGRASEGTPKTVRRSKFGILGARANRAKTPRSRSQDVQSVPAGGDSQDSLKMMLQSKSTKCTDDDVEETSANMIQVRHKVTHLKTPIERKGKDEKKKRGECKAESQPKLVRRLRSSCQCTKSEEKLSFFSIQPTIDRVSTSRRASRASIPSPRSPPRTPSPSTASTGTEGSSTRAIF